MIFPMSKRESIHNKLLMSAAKRALRPLGLIQKGRSRTWLADQGWWLVVVEFQSSTWDPGSYLNVGCMWLWNVHDHLSFDVGHRVTDFQPFETEQQFNPIAHQLAEQAGDKVAEYRERFRTVGQVSDYYMQNPPDSFWPNFDAATAHVMSGRMKPASALLSRCVTAEENDPLWLSNARNVARTMASMIGEQLGFQRFISDRVHESRHLHKLLPLEHIDFGSERIVPE
jgi:hypothetical protein